MNSLAEQPPRFIDSHTGGEPTRLLIEGGPDLGNGSMAERRERFMHEHDAWRRALVNEPRGSDVLVGALLCAPVDAANCCGVIFFNNVGYLGMCGHGTIGLIATLAHLRRIQPGVHGVETPVGTVTATLHEDGSVSIGNVASRRALRHVPLQVPGHGLVHGDVAWGGNWFFLCHDHGLELVPTNIRELERMSEAIRQAMLQAGLRGDDGLEIDHIELLGPPKDEANHGRSFVMCPGGAYDRSPCGTGTSAKMACLAADGALAPGQIWRQESVIGSVFEASYQPAPDGSAAALPTIRGRAHVTLDAQVLIDPSDPWAWGLPLA